MQLSLEEYRRRFPNRPLPALAGLAGEWVAWNGDRTQIVAHGEQFAEVHAAALAAGCERPRMQKTLVTPFVGTGRSRG